MTLAYGDFFLYCDALFQVSITYFTRVIYYTYSVWQDFTLYMQYDRASLYKIYLYECTLKEKTQRVTDMHVRVACNEHVTVVAWKRTSTPDLEVGLI